MAALFGVVLIKILSLHHKSKVMKVMKYGRCRSALPKTAQASIFTEELDTYLPEGFEGLDPDVELEKSNVLIVGPTGMSPQ